MKKVTAVHEYEHDVETVYEAFTDPDFYVDKFEGIGCRNVEVHESAEDDDGGFEIEVQREVKADAPAILQAIIGEWNTLIQSESWQIIEDGEEYSNELEIESESTPVTITGTMTLTAEEDGCVNEVELKIRCSVPLVGKKVEDFVAKDTAASLAAEYEFIQEYLDSE